MPEACDRSGGWNGERPTCSAARFPKAQVVGVDNSPAMPEKARTAGFTTQLADIETWSPVEPVDIILAKK